MLARTRINPRSIHPELTEAHLDALEWVRDELRAGRWGHAKYLGPTKRRMFDRSCNDDVRFNMLAWGKRANGCGTVCCIGGLADMRLKQLGLCELIPFKELDHADHLCALFYPQECRLTSITPAAAADAIDMFVHTSRVPVGW